MADSLLRDLERSVAAGDEGARHALARAYVRRGRPQAALAALRGGGPSLRAFEQRLWEGFLARLRPVVRFRGAAAHQRLVGWLDGGRYAAVQAMGGLRVVDLRSGEELSPQRFPRRLVGEATSEGALYARAGRRLLRFRPAEGAWPEEVVELSAVPGRGEAQIVSADPQERWLVVAQRFTLFVSPRPATGSSFSAWGAALVDTERFEPRWLRACVRMTCDWSRRRFAWAEQDGSFAWGCLDEPDEAHPLPGQVPLAAVGGFLRAPVPGGAVGPLAGGRDGPAAAVPFDFFPDGRLVWGDPLRAYDLDALEPGPQALCGASLRGPVRPSLDGAALLGLSAEGGQLRPVRVPLGARRAPLGSLVGPGDVAWHPRADLAAWSPDRGPAVLVRFVGTRARRLRRLPPGHRPLGWTPDGTGLLLIKALSSTASLLELWSADGAPIHGGSR